MGLLTSLQEEVKRLKEEKSGSTVDSALAQVRNLAAKSEGVTGAVLMSAFEHLADTATLAGHEDAEFYRSGVKECKEFVGKSNLRLLVTRLIGTTAAKKVATSVDAWRKSNGKNDQPTSSGASTTGSAAAQSQDVGASNQVMANMMAMAPWAMMFGGQMPGSAGGQYGGRQNRRFGRGRGDYGGSSRGPRRCYKCNSTDHMIAACPVAEGGKNRGGT